MFSMSYAKPVSLVLAIHFKLTKKDFMAIVPYSSVIGSLMYAIVCIRPNIAYAMGVVSRYTSNPGKQH